MAQGKKYTEKERKEIFEKIKPFLKLGYSLKKSCIFANVSYDAVVKWVSKDKKLSNLVKTLRSDTSIKARQGLRDKIENEKHFYSMTWWLENFERDDFHKKSKVEAEIDINVKLKKEAQKRIKAFEQGVNDFNKKDKEEK